MANQADLTSEGTEYYSSAAVENARQVTTVQSVLMGLAGHNTDAANPAYIWVFDLATAPIAASVPVIIIPVPNFSITAPVAGYYTFLSPTPYGIKFKKGIYIGSSSTDLAAGYTALASSKQVFSVFYAFEDGTTNPS